MSENEVETCLCPNSSTQLPSRYLYAPIEISSAMSLFHFETASGHGNSRGYHIGIIHTTSKISRIRSYSVRMRENTDQYNSEYRYLLRSDRH